MKRDMDIVRLLLLRIESLSLGDTYYTDNQEECYHLKIMLDGKLVDGWVESDGVDGFTADISGLTWKGHEFLDTVRNDSVWDKVKQHFKENGVGMAIDTIVTVAIKMAGNILKG